jgi:hypothetical protein
MKVKIGNTSIWVFFFNIWLSSEFIAHSSHGRLFDHIRHASSHFQDVELGRAVVYHFLCLLIWEPAYIFEPYFYSPPADILQIHLA